MKLQAKQIELTEVTFLNYLKKKSIHPVTEIDKKLCNTGWFIHSSRGIYSPDGARIEINTHMSTSEKEGTLVHEIGHGRCYKRGCKCYKKYDRVLQEVHAELYALHLLLRNQEKNAIIARFKRWKDNWDDSSDDEYCKALKIIKKRRIYKRCQEFVRNKNE